MRALLLALALTAGCYFHARPVEFDYETCYHMLAPSAACEVRYEWIPGYWTFDGVWLDGYYRLRPEYHHRRPHRRHR